jgi:hypothetical protein
MDVVRLTARRVALLAIGVGACDPDPPTDLLAALDDEALGQGPSLDPTLLATATDAVTLDVEAGHPPDLLAVLPGRLRRYQFQNGVALPRLDLAVPGFEPRLHGSTSGRALVSWAPDPDAPERDYAWTDGDSLYLLPDSDVEVVDARAVRSWDQTRLLQVGHLDGTCVARFTLSNGSSSTILLDEVGAADCADTEILSVRHTLAVLRVGSTPWIVGHSYWHRRDDSYRLEGVPTSGLIAAVLSTEGVLLSWEGSELFRRYRWNGQVESTWRAPGRVLSLAPEFDLFDGYHTLIDEPVAGVTHSTWTYSGWVRAVTTPSEAESGPLFTDLLYTFRRVSAGVRVDP